MLYLVSGTSRSGKSLIARRLLAEKGIPYFPLDAVVMGFTNGMPEWGIHDKLFPQEIAKRMWTFVQALCESLLYMGQDYCLEGEALLPAKARHLLDAHAEKIRCCFLGYSDTTPERKVAEINTHRTLQNDWLLNQSDSYIFEHVTHMIEYSKFIRQECRAHKIQYFDVSETFDRAIEDAVGYLVS